MTDYKPQYTQSDIENLESEGAKLNVIIEEAAQRKAAEKWQIAREVNGSGNLRDWLDTNGFVLNDNDSDLFLGVVPPDGWTKSTSGFWTEIKDSTGTIRAERFFKGAWYDSRAFINLK